MKTDWALIEEKIENNISEIFIEGIPRYPDVKEAVDLFKKVILYKSNIKELDGLPKILIPALHEAYINKKGELGPLRHISTTLESYLKKIIVLCKNQSFESLSKSNLVSLYKTLQLNTSLSNQKKGDYPQLTKENLNQFKGEPEYLEYLCYARIIRNQVHNSPNWNEIEVFTYLRNILVVYLYSAIKYKVEIQSLPKRDVSVTKSLSKIDTEENKMLFDFISFGNTTTEIKTQAINAYILHFLTDNGENTLEEIKENANNYFGKELNIRFFERRINSLIQNGQVEYSNSGKSSYKLAEKEKSRLAKIRKDFKENKELFFLYFDDIIVKYKLEKESDKIISKLKLFFEANFDIDVSEAYDKGIDISRDESSIYCHLFNYLKSITTDEKTAENLFKDLLSLCNDSDFLIRLSASKVFSNLTNPDQFHNYIRLQERNVYLDTQIILHALCLGYSRNVKYDNIYYRITDELIQFSKDNPNINLKFSKLYLAEVAYQLKLALLLIPFEEFDRDNFSNNIFYLFYYYLKTNDLLSEDENSFADFLENWLLVKEDDVYLSDFEQVAKLNLQSLLKDELNIEVIHLPKYENRDAAISLLEEVIKKNLYTPKSRHILTNDALMVCHLSDNSYHQIEPFFLTWDKSFTEYRKEYKMKFNRLETISWHLFNPSKFLNHMALLDFRIDSKSITNEYLSIIDSLGIHEKTQTIYDNVNKLLDLKDISKSQRRKYIKIVDEIFNEKEFSYNVDLPENEITRNLSISFGQIIEDINNYYQSDSSDYSIHTYRKVMLDEDYFIKIFKVIANEVKVSLKSDLKSISYLTEIDFILKQYCDAQESKKY